MNKLYSFVRKQSLITLAVIASAVLIMLSLLSFNMNVNAYIKKDMRSQIEAIQQSSNKLVQNELNNLKRQTALLGESISLIDLSDNQAISEVLSKCTIYPNIVQAVFIAPDGRTFTNDAGYLNGKYEPLMVDDIAATAFDEAYFSHPYISEEFDDIVFKLVYPLNLKQGRATLVTSYRISQFTELLKNDFINGAAEIGILDSKGYVIIGNDETEFQIDVLGALSGVNFSSSSPDEMRTNFSNGTTGFSSYYIQESERYCAYAPVEINDWYTIVMVKEDSLRSRLAQFEKFGILLTVELIAIMMVLSCIILTIHYREQKKIQEILQQAAMMDGLTGIYNRNTTENEISDFLKNKKKYINSALLVIDIDNFKLINDTFGHLYGDYVLKECALLLKHIFEKESIVGRVGGDEFVVLIKNCSDIIQIQGKSREFIDSFYVKNSNGEMQKISVSVGISLSNDTGSSFLELYEKADASLYCSKSQGKGCFSI